MAAEIKYEIIGDNNFLRQAEYSFYIPGMIQEYQDKFQLAEKVEIEFEEDINPNPNKIKPQEYEVSEDGKKIKLVYKTEMHNQPNKDLSEPDEQSFFSGFRFYFENTVIKEDNERFERLNNNQEEE